MPYSRKYRGASMRKHSYKVMGSAGWNVKKGAMTPAPATRRIYYQRSKKGYLRIIRKLPDICVANSALNTPTLTDPTGTVQIGNIQPSAGFPANTYDIPFSIKFTLSSLINSSDITNLADKYKIRGAYVRLYYNNSNSSTGSAGGMPFIQYHTDHDDVTVPTVQRVRETMGVKLVTFRNASSYIGIKCNPRPTREIFGTGITSAYEIPTKSVWIDCNNNTVEHYGVKGVISQMFLPAPASANSVLKFDIALVVEAKDFQ